MKSSAYIIGWIAYFQLISLLLMIYNLTLLIGFGLLTPDAFKVEGFESYKGLGLYILTYLIWDVASIHCLLWLSTFFTSSKVAVQVTMILFTASSYLYLLMPWLKENLYDK